MPKGNNEKPILFSAPMVRVILDGQKSQTRRVVKWPLHSKSNGACRRIFSERDVEDVKKIIQSEPRHPHQMLSTGYRNGDRLWVRESFYVQPDLWSAGHGPQPVHYAADTPADQVEDYVKKPSIRMPRWASRIMLEIVDVRVERLQEIDEEDALAEGVQPDGDMRWTPVRAFEYLWDSINAKRGYGWDKNPWVWVYEFKVVNADAESK